MPEQRVQSIFFRQITPADFYNIERGPGTDKRGGSQTYIDIPLGQGLSLLEQLWSFAGLDPLPDPSGTWPPLRIPVAAIGNPTQVAELEFAPRQGNKRYRISNQARQKAGSMRHPAWTAAEGFPAAPNDVSSKNDPRLPDTSTLKIYVVKTESGEYYAGHVNSAAMPANWPKGFNLERMFQVGAVSDMIQVDNAVAMDTPPLVYEILKAWSKKKNVLLYGPPGTGKTYAMQVLWSLLDTKRPLRALMLDPNNRQAPFSSTEVDLPLEAPIRREWTTFHQNYSYEHFILALRPEPSLTGLTLKPRLGLLLDAAVSTDKDVKQEAELAAKTSVVFIDEINRGNVSRIFGEFITFMDEEYRADSKISAIPVPLGSLKVKAKQTEMLERPAGGEVQLPVPWYFPPSVYVLASMNSVDRAVAPLDSALARRFLRIEVRPDLTLLANELRISDTAALLRRAVAQRAVPDDNVVAPEAADDAEIGEDTETDAAGAGEDVVAVDAVTDGTDGAEEPAITASEVAWLLLYRINYELAATLGRDFEIGHTYIFPVSKAETEDEKYRTLAYIWDQAIYPQLQERFVNRPDELARFLRMDTGRGTIPRGYLFRMRARPGGIARTLTATRDVLDVPPIARGSLEEIKVTLRYLAGA